MAQSNVGNSLAKAVNRPQPFSVYLNQDATKRWISNMLGGDNAQSQRFMTAVVSAVSSTPALAECTHVSIITAALAGEALKLSPSPQMGQYYIVPYKDKATFVIGYKGYIQLAIRSGYYRHINVIAVKRGELVSFNPLTEDIELNIIQNDTIREAAETTGYCAFFEYMNGFKKVMYWSKEKMLAHADKYSPAFNAEKYEQLLAGKIPKSEAWKYSSFWYKDFDGMAFKTMLRQLISKWGIMSIELQKAYASDGAFINEKMEPEFLAADDFVEPEAPAPTQDKPETTAAKKAEPEPNPEPAQDIEDDPFSDWPQPGTPEYEELSRRLDMEAAEQDTNP